jgi:AcrR family transcriptional regulator
LTSKAERLQAKADRLQANLDKIATKTKARAEKLERLAARLDALEVWWREEPGQRQARFSRNELARAAVRIADDEGLDALSMRRLAQEVGAGTMTLYHYVRNKDELLTLVSDEVLAEVLVRDSRVLSRGWREALVHIAVRSRNAIRRHPWVLDISNEAGFGPNSIKHFDQTLQAVADLDVPLATKLDIVFAVDEYVFGYCLQERGGDMNGRQKGALVRYVEDLVRTGDYPQLRAYMDELGTDAVWKAFDESRADGERFERNLRRLLDGIALDLGL